MKSFQNLLFKADTYVRPVAESGILGLVHMKKQMERLRNVKRGVIEMVTAKRRLELQATKVQGNISQLDGQARQALEAGWRA
jgi:hypothetical protein